MASHRSRTASAAAGPSGASGPSGSSAGGVRRAAEATLSMSDARLFLHDGLSLLLAAAQPADVRAVQQQLEDMDAARAAQRLQTTLLFPEAEALLRQPGALAMEYQRLAAFRQAFIAGFWLPAELGSDGLGLGAAAAAPPPASASAGGSGAVSRTVSVGMREPGQTAMGAQVAQLTLALLAPLLESQSRVDAGLIPGTVAALLAFLQALTPTALRGTPAACIDGLERVLQKWLRLSADNLAAAGANVEDIASALTAFMLARDTLESSISMLNMLTQHVRSDAELPIADYLRHYAASQLGIAPGALLNSESWPFTFPPGCEAVTDIRHPKHPHPLRRYLKESGWNCDGSCNYRSSRSPIPMPRFRCTQGCDYDLCLNCMGEHAEFPASIASDGRFLYVSDAEHRSLLKIGSGREGTVEGKVYAYIAGGDAPEGEFAFASSRLLLKRRAPFLKSTLAELYSPITLTLLGVVLPPELQRAEAREHNKQTLHFFGDGQLLYRTRVADGAASPTSASRLRVLVDVFRLPDTIHFGPRESESATISMKLSVSKSTYPDLGIPHVVVSDLQLESPFYGDLAVGDAITHVNDVAVNSVEDVEARLTQIRREGRAEGNPPPRLRIKFIKRSVLAELLRTVELCGPADFVLPAASAQATGTTTTTTRSASPVVGVLSRSASAVPPAAADGGAGTPAAAAVPGGGQLQLLSAGMDLGVVLGRASAMAGPGSQSVVVPASALVSRGGAPSHAPPAVVAASPAVANVVPPGVSLLMAAAGGPPIHPGVGSGGTAQASTSAGGQGGNGEAPARPTLCGMDLPTLRSCRATVCNGGLVFLRSVICASSSSSSSSGGGGNLAAAGFGLGYYVGSQQQRQAPEQHQSRAYGYGQPHQQQQQQQQQSLPQGAPAVLAHYAFDLQTGRALVDGVWQEVALPQDGCFANCKTSSWAVCADRGNDRYWTVCNGTIDEWRNNGTPLYLDMELGVCAALDSLGLGATCSMPAVCQVLAHAVFYNSLRLASAAATTSAAGGALPTSAFGYSGSVSSDGAGLTRSVSAAAAAAAAASRSAAGGSADSVFGSDGNRTPTTPSGPLTPSASSTADLASSAVSVGRHFSSALSYFASVAAEVIGATPDAAARAESCQRIISMLLMSLAKLLRINGNPLEAAGRETLDALCRLLHTFAAASQPPSVQLAAHSALVGGLALFYNTPEQTAVLVLETLQQKDGASAAELPTRLRDSLMENGAGQLVMQCGRIADSSHIQQVFDALLVASEQSTMEQLRQFEQQGDTADDVIVGASAPTLAAAVLLRAALVPLLADAADMVNPATVPPAATTAPSRTATSDTVPASPDTANTIDADLAAVRRMAFAVVEAVQRIYERIAGLAAPSVNVDAGGLRSLSSSVQNRYRAQLQDILAASLAGHLLQPLLQALPAKHAMLGDSAATLRLLHSVQPAMAMAAAVLLGPQAQKVQSHPHSAFSMLLPLQQLPWATMAQRVETSHPVRDGYQLTRTVAVPGATALLLTIDPRSATLTEADCLSIFAGPSTSSPKVAECAGSAALSNSTWPSQPLRVPGAEVTLSFEVRSGREAQGVPDLYSWGFAVDVRGLDAAGSIISTVDAAGSSSSSSTTSTSTSSSHHNASLLFPLDLHLGVVRWMASAAAAHFRSLPPTEQEHAVRAVVPRSVTRAVAWDAVDATALTSASSLDVGAAAQLAAADVQVIRRLTHVRSPATQPRLQAQLNLLDLERLELTAALRLAGAYESALAFVRSLQQQQQTAGGAAAAATPAAPPLLEPWLLRLMTHQLRQVTTLQRQLVNLAQLERAWLMELDDERQARSNDGGAGATTNAPRYFEAWVHEHDGRPARLADLRSLCLLFCPEQRKRDGDAMVDALRGCFNQQLAQLMAQPEQEVVFDPVRAMQFAKAAKERAMLLVWLLTTAPAESSVGDGAGLPVIAIGEGGVGAAPAPARVGTTPAGEVDEAAGAAAAVAAADPRAFLRSISAPPLLARLAATAEVEAATNSAGAATGVSPDAASRRAAALAADVSGFVSGQLLNPTGDAPLSGQDMVDVLQRHRQRAEALLEGLQGLQNLLELAASGQQTASAVAAFVVEMAVDVLLRGSHTRDICYSGLCGAYRGLFGRLLQSLVSLISADPASRMTGLAVCLLPFEPEDTSVLVRSGLVLLIDSLCNSHVGSSGGCGSGIDIGSTSGSGLSTPTVDSRASPLLGVGAGSSASVGGSGPAITPAAAVAGTSTTTLPALGTPLVRHAWAALEVLAAHCVRWEGEYDSYSHTSNSAQAANATVDLTTSASLPCVIAAYLVSHLSRAVAAVASSSAIDVPDEVLASALEQLRLLETLAGSQLGQAVLAAPSCLVALLSLLTAEAATPGMLHIVFRLLAIALPAMPTGPALKQLLRPVLSARLQQHLPELLANATTTGNVRVAVASLLLSSLAELMVPPLPASVSASSGPAAATSQQPQQHISSDSNESAAAGRAATTAAAVAATVAADVGSAAAMGSPATPRNPGSASGSARTRALSDIGAAQAGVHTPAGAGGAPDSGGLRAAMFESPPLHLQFQPFSGEMVAPVGLQSPSLAHLMAASVDAAVAAVGGAVAGGGDGLGVGGVFDVPGASVGAATPAHGGGIASGSSSRTPPAGRFVVLLHKREDQTSREIIQILLRAQQRRTLGGNHDQLEQAARIDREFGHKNTATVYRGNYPECLRRARDFAALGLVTSVERDERDAQSRDAAGHAAEDRLCHERNVDILRSEAPRRRFVSSAVAGECIHQLISLLHSLMVTAPSGLTAQTGGSAAAPWVEALELVLSQVLSQVPTLTPRLAGTATPSPSSSRSSASTASRPVDVQQQAYLALACFAVLGGFREEVHVGTHVLVGGSPGLRPVVARVEQVDRNRNEATVVLLNGRSEMVPLSALQSQHEEPPAVVTQLVTWPYMAALEALLLQGVNQPLGVQAAVPGADSSTAAATGGGWQVSPEQLAVQHRLLAEMRTRACMVLALRARTPQFAETMTNQAPKALTTLVRLAQEAQRVAGEPLAVVQAACAELRAVFYEMNRPRIHSATKGGNAAPLLMGWQVRQTDPPLRFVVFSHSDTTARLVPPRSGSGSGSGSASGVSSLDAQQASSAVSGIHALLARVAGGGSGLEWGDDSPSAGAQGGNGSSGDGGGDGGGLSFASWRRARERRGDPSSSGSGNGNGSGGGGSSSSNANAGAPGPNAGPAIVFGTKTIPAGCDVFYFEVSVVALGEGRVKPAMAVGLSPAVEVGNSGSRASSSAAAGASGDAAGGAATIQWPTGTVVFESTGSLCHQRGSDSQQRTAVGVTIAEGNVVGVAWLAEGSTIRFTRNGELLAAAKLQGVPRNAYPVILLGNPNTELAANFGASPFRFDPENLLRAPAGGSSGAGSGRASSVGSASAAGAGGGPAASGHPSVSSAAAAGGGGAGAAAIEEEEDVEDQTSDLFAMRPLNLDGDDDVYVPALPSPGRSKSAGKNGSGSSLVDVQTVPHGPDQGRLTQRHPAFVVSQVGSTMLGSTAVAVGEEEEEEEDLSEKLVKQWEKDVFPKISQRFRNSSERRSGFEQIKGALQMGMEDIARMTVEYLYEENGGLPADLHLPTMEELKAESSKLAAGQLRPGMQVRIVGDDARRGYMVADMAPTVGLLGTVVSVDSAKGLAQVDVYLADAARLVHWWYPITVLQRAMESGKSGGGSNGGNGGNGGSPSPPECQRTLLMAESKLTRLYCRQALLYLSQRIGNGAGNTPTASSTTTTSAQVLRLPETELLRLNTLELLRGSLPAHCILTEAGVANWLLPAVSLAAAPSASAESVSRLRQAVGDALRRAGPQAESLLRRLWDVFFNPGAHLQQAELSVDMGRRAFDVEFKEAAGALVTVCAQSSDSAVVAIPTSATAPTAWARFYVGSNGTGPQFSIFPNTNAGGRTPLPYLHFSTRRLHVRTTATPDANPKARLVVHGLPEDLPLALLLVQWAVEGEVAVSPASWSELAQALLQLVTQWAVGPALRETLLHALASVLRFTLAAQQLAEVREAVLEALAETGGAKVWQGFVDEAMGLYAGRNTALGSCQHTTALVAVVEVLLAVAETRGWSVLKEEESSSVKDKSRTVSAASAAADDVVEDLVDHDESDDAASEAAAAAATTASLAAGASAGSAPENPIGAMQLPPGWALDLSAPPSGSRRLRSASGGGRLGRSGGGASGGSGGAGEVLGRRRYVARGRGGHSPSSGSVGSRGGASPSSAVAASSAAAAALPLSLPATPLPTFLSPDGRSPRPTSPGGDAATSTKPNVPAWLNQATETVKLLRLMGQPTSAWAGAAPDPSAVLCGGEGMGASLSAADASSSASHNRTPRDLVRRGWARLLSTNPASKILVLGNLRQQMSVAEMARMLKRCAALHGGLVADNGLFLPADEQGNCQGYAVMELKQARLAQSCEQALRDEPRLGQSGSVVVQPLQLQNDAGRVLQLSVTFVDGTDVSGDALSRAATVRRPELSEAAKQQLRQATDEFLRWRLLEDGDGAVSLQYALVTLLAGGTTDAGLTVDEVVRAAPVTSDSPLDAVTPAALVHTFVKELLAGGSGGSLRDTLLKAAGSGSASSGAGGSGALAVSDLLALTVECCHTCPQAVAHALLLLGYDLRLRRVRDVSLSLAESSMRQQPWSAEADAQLVAYADSVARSLHLSPLQLAAVDMELTDADLMDNERRLLRSFSPKDVWLRLAMLQALNQPLSAVLPLLDLRTAQHPLSAACVIRGTRPLIFYSVQQDWLNSLLDDTAQRMDSKGPEITLNPLAVLPAAAAPAGLMPASGEDESGDSDEAGGDNTAAPPSAEPGVSVDEGQLQQLEEGEEAEAHTASAPFLLAAAKNSQFYEAMVQLEKVNPAELRVKLASGGDPIFPVTVKLTGERVAGNSGSFRDMMLRMAQELQSGLVPLLMPCPSSAVGRNVGRWLLRPGPHTYPVVKQLRFFGQLIGLSLRSGVPLDLDLLPCFWRGLVGDPLSRRDIYDADKLLDDQLRAVEAAATEEEFEAYARQHRLRFAIRSLTGQLRPLPVAEDLLGGLASGGLTTPDASPVARNDSDWIAPSPLPTAAGMELQLPVAQQSQQQEQQFVQQHAQQSQQHVQMVPFHLRHAYVALAQEARLVELRNDVAMTAIREGLRTVVPTEALQMLSWQSLELRVCGVPDVDLNFLRRHTTYTSGLSETDPHIVHFWQALEQMPKHELRKFVKFACNQERIPSAYPDDDGSGNLKHTPPYPMKIAPPDENAWRASAADERLIRAETCMFMIKLPQYSSLDVMTERLRQAISCRDDPLIG